MVRVSRSSLGSKIKELRAERGWTQNELAKRSGVDRGALASIETGKVANPSPQNFLKLARAFNIRPEELYQAAGYVSDAKTAYQYKETPEEILDRLKLATPVSIPVYADFPFQPGSPVEPVEHVYRAPIRGTRMTIEAYIVRGKCLEPEIRDQDIIVVDREAAMDNGDIVAGLIDGEMHLGKLRKVADELYLENNHGRFKFEDCQVAAPVIEVIRRLK